MFIHRLKGGPPPHPHCLPVPLETKGWGGPPSPVSCRHGDHPPVSTRQPPTRHRVVCSTGSTRTAGQPTGSSGTCGPSPGRDRHGRPFADSTRSDPLPTGSSGTRPGTDGSTRSGLTANGSTRNPPRTDCSTRSAPSAVGSSRTGLSPVGSTRTPRLPVGSTRTPRPAAPLERLLTCRFRRPRHSERAVGGAWLRGRRSLSGRRWSPARSQSTRWSPTRPIWSNEKGFYPTLPSFRLHQLERRSGTDAMKSGCGPAHDPFSTAVWGNLHPK